MSSSYLPENCYVVCNNQNGTDYRMLKADADAREISVFYKGNRAFLTVADKKINEDFSFKSSWSKGLSQGALIGGIGVASGMFAAATMAAVVPGIGWIVGGAIAIIAIGYSFWKIKSSPKCTGALGNSSSKWIMYQKTVSFNKHNAILSSSKLVCGEGGILIPYISEIAAKRAAIIIGNINQTDIALNTIVGGLTGYGLGAGAVRFPFFWTIFNKEKYTLNI